MTPLYSNHITNNIMTRGNMNISAITRGFILPAFQFEIVTKKGGGSSYYDAELYDQIRKENELRQRDLSGATSGTTDHDIEHINVMVDWGKNNDKSNKKIYAELIEKKITAQLLTKFNESYKINVILLDK